MNHYNKNANHYNKKANHYNITAKTCQSGFIFPSGLTLYAGLGALILLGLMAIALKVQTVRLASVKSEYALFVVETKAAGEAQNAMTKQIEAKHNKIVKEKNDENLLAHADLAVTVKRLRDNNSRRGLVSIAPAGASRPELACYSRAELDHTLRTFTGSVGDLVIEGESATIDLNTAKDWAKALK